ncbi:ABC transporter ATP-binding protein [Microbacterium sp. ET2]|uniref:ABC transporter ATP-binding protein n=1 Tax=Microbacterium albipurpureum TaxID=3050384 RepID=UPI00259C8B26|nr:ABC transporter ATP-binding protein [Microbacterium sp. ET2 (Ac-2212)]WJL96348.1 ABC transporter ATP-binding protein [Microbacterium sp. ET2 (Ac-2212)]
MSVAALDARGLVRRFGDVVAVDHVDLSVRQGELVALLGPSGCGKTSILRLVAGLDRGEGSVDIAGVRMSGGARFVPPEARGVGLVFQDSVLFPHLDVAGNAAFGLRGADRMTQAGRILDLLGIAHLAARMPSEISGGEQQRVALARTLAARPALVLLDEPFSHLDASLRERVREETVAALRRTGTSALMVTHDQGEALAVADRVMVMGAGRIHQTGEPAEVYRRPADRFTAEFVGRSTLVPVRVTRPGVAITPLGDVAVDPATPLGVRLAVLRPESVSLTDPEAGLGATVVRALFRGADRLVRLVLPGGGEIEAVTSADLSPGDRVGVRVTGVLATVAEDRPDAALITPRVTDPPERAASARR